MSGCYIFGFNFSKHNGSCSDNQLTTVGIVETAKLAEFLADIIVYLRIGVSDPDILLDSFNKQKERLRKFIRFAVHNTLVLYYFDVEFDFIKFYGRVIER